jgi:hypothetical protein
MSFGRPDYTNFFVPQMQSLFGDEELLQGFYYLILTQGDEDYIYNDVFSDEYDFYIIKMVLTSFYPGHHLTQIKCNSDYLFYEHINTRWDYTANNVDVLKIAAGDVFSIQISNGYLYTNQFTLNIWGYYKKINL